MTAPLDPAALFRRLHEAGVRYVVVGGADLAAESISAEVAGVPVTVCSRAHLIAMKRAADRPLDRADLDQLEADD